MLRISRIPSKTTSCWLIAAARLIVGCPKTTVKLTAVRQGTFILVYSSEFYQVQCLFGASQVPSAYDVALSNADWKAPYKTKAREKNICLSCKKKFPGPDDDSDPEIFI